MGCREGCGRQLKGGGQPRRARPVWKAGEIPGGGRGRALREEEDGPDAWGRAGSGGASDAERGGVGARWQAGPGECGVRGGRAGVGLVTRLSERAGLGECVRAG